MSKGLFSNSVNGDPPLLGIHYSKTVLSFLELGVAIQKKIPWIIVELLLVPFSWLISYLQWCDKQPEAKDGEKTPQEGIENDSVHTQSKGWHIAGFVIVILTLALTGYLMGYKLPSWPAWGRTMVTALLATIAISLLSNISTILFMYFLTTAAIAKRRNVLVSRIESHHGQMVAELKKHDATTANSFKDSYWRMDQILGHKVWAEERTFKFLSRIVQNEANEKAKWQMVNFLSRLADNHIFPEEDSGYFKITTQSSGTWHISEYSDFLSDNIMHASKEIRWLVDPRDFGKYLIPYCVSYLLGSIAAKTVGLPSKSVWNERSAVSCDYFFSRMIKKACPTYCDETATRKYLHKLAADHHSERMQQNGFHAREHGTEAIAEQAIFLMQGRSVGWWHDLHDVVLPGIAYFGNEVIKKDGVPDEKVIIEGFSELYDSWIRRAFPHIDSFRRASAERAFRQLLLPQADTVQLALQMVADNLSQTIFNEANALRELSMENRLTVLRLAFRLFSELSGGAKRIDVCGFKGPSTEDEIGSYDVGLYDGKFLVRSIANGDFRQVEWYYLFQRPKKDEQLPRDIKYLMEILEYETTAKLSILLKDTLLWKSEYEHSTSEYDILSDVLCDLIVVKWRNG